MTSTPSSDHGDNLSEAESASSSMLMSLEALEIEPDPEDEEYESLIREQEENEIKSSENYLKKRMKRAFSSAKGVLRMNNRSRTGGSSSSIASFSGGVGGLDHRRDQQQQQQKSHKFSTRNVVLLCFLAISTTWFLRSEDTVVERIEEDVSDSNRVYHQSSFGGVKNVLHPAGAKAAAAAEKDDKKQYYSSDAYIKTSIVPHAVPSLNIENLLNHWGNYVHDEHRSPYASHLYKMDKKDLEEEQRLYVEKMGDVRKDWGAWDLKDPYYYQEGRDDEQKPRPYVDFHQAPYRDVSTDDFPKGSWQADEGYVRMFIDEAKSLVDRVLEGIYAEYGFPTKKEDGTLMTTKEKEERDKLWQVNIEDATSKKDNSKNTGVASINKVGWELIQRKLLHAMITNDEFYYVLGGHSAAAGHGNDFIQTKAMEFHYIMEPVFDKLGMRLISRNMAQGGVGTTHSAMAGSHIYGESDIIHWDSGMTEKNPGALDLFNKQAILSGERVPLLVDVNPIDIVEESNNTVGLANLIGGIADGIPVTMDEEQVETLPFAVRYLACDKQREDLCKKRENKYSAVCWVPRKDVKPPSKQNTIPGSQVSWHPGDVSHKYEARKLTVFVLHAINAALDLWKDGMEKDGFPLKESYWHVGESYEKTRRILLENISNHRWSPPPVDDDSPIDPRSHCEKTFIDYPRVCRVPMKGYGEWTPIAQTKHYLHSIVKHAPNGYYPHPTVEEVYSGINLQAYNQRVPYGEVDVHAIAIATTNPPPDLDHSWDYDDDEIYDDDAENQERLLLKEEGKDTIMSEKEITNEKLVRGSGHSVERVPLPPLSPMNISNIHNTEHIDSTKYSRRRLENEEEIIPGQGWVLGNGGQGWKTGFCDGSTMSTCARAQDNDCLYYGHNDGRSNFIGDQLSGWIVFEIPNVKYGIILFRLEWWIENKFTERTKDWTKVNNGMTKDTTPYDATTPPIVSSEGTSSDETNSNTTTGERARSLTLADSAVVDFAVNGKINTMNITKFNEYAHETVKNFALWPVLDDETMAQREWKEDETGETFEVAMRIRSNEPSTLAISHIFYA